MIYSFYDDYSEGVHSEILKYISEHNGDQQLGYGRDEYCDLAKQRIKTAFGVPGADIHFLPNGTGANVIGLVSMLKPFEGVISPASGHINTHETGALEAAGHKVIWVETPDGKLTPDFIDRALTSYEDEHTVMPRVVYLTQATEHGTVYSKAELEAVIAHAKSKGLYTYLDGARLAMALGSSKAGISLSEFGQLGLDMFYIGGTKNGGLYGEALVILNDAFKPNFRSYIKRGGGMMAKGRFMGQQFARFFDDDNLWLGLGKHADQMADDLYKGLMGLDISFDQDTGTNQLFPILPNDLMATLQKDYGFYEWKKIDEGHTQIRLVCSWATKPVNVETFLVAVKAAASSNT
jgi:threonine aldolase